LEAVTRVINRPILGYELDHVAVSGGSLFEGQ
jgi:hypothetical protein